MRSEPTRDFVTLGHKGAEFDSSFCDRLLWRDWVQATLIEIMIPISYYSAFLSTMGCSLKKCFSKWFQKHTS
jgi:hypothetical protein